MADPVGPRYTELMSSNSSAKKKKSSGKSAVGGAVAPPALVVEAAEAVVEAPALVVEVAEAVEAPTGEAAVVEVAAEVAVPALVEVAETTAVVTEVAVVAEPAEVAEAATGVADVVEATSVEAEEDEFPASPVNYDEPGLFETMRDEGLYRFDAGKQGTALCLSLRSEGSWRWRYLGELRWDGRDLRSRALDRRLLDGLSKDLRRFSEEAAE